MSTEKTGGRYSGVGGCHWIKEVASGGAYVTLEDGSLWEITTIDRIDTSLWLSITNITVLVDKNPIGEFRYILVNKDDGEEAHARYVSNVSTSYTVPACIVAALVTKMIPATQPPQTLQNY